MQFNLSLVAERCNNLPTVCNVELALCVMHLCTVYFMSLALQPVCVINGEVSVSFSRALLPLLSLKQLLSLNCSRAMSFLCLCVFLFYCNVVSVCSCV